MKALLISLFLLGSISSFGKNCKVVLSMDCSLGIPCSSEFNLRKIKEKAQEKSLDLINDPREADFILALKAKYETSYGVCSEAIYTKLRLIDPKSGNTLLSDSKLDCMELGDLHQLLSPMVSIMRKVSALPDMYGKCK